jgi:hypothetical protein
MNATSEKEYEVRDLYDVLVDTNNDLLILKPKKGLDKSLFMNVQILSGEQPLEDTEAYDGTRYVPITKYATCTTINDCKVVTKDSDMHPSPSPEMACS